MEDNGAGGMKPRHRNLHELFERMRPAEEARRASGLAREHELAEVCNKLLSATMSRRSAELNEQALAFAVDALRTNRWACREGRLENGNCMLHLLAGTAFMNRGDAKARAEARAVWAPAMAFLGQQIHWENMAGRRPLHVASFKLNLQMAEELVAMGADLEAVDMSGDTALHDAARSGDEKICALLLAHGANPLALNAKKMFPAQLAQRFSRGTTAPAHALLLSAQEAAQLSAEMGSSAVASGPKPAVRL